MASPTMTRPKSTARVGPARWILYGVSVLGIALLATQLFYFVQIVLIFYMLWGLLRA